jgi:recombination protein RecT
MSKELIQAKSLKDLLAQDSYKARFREILGNRGPQLAAALLQLHSQQVQLRKCEPNSIIGCGLMAAAIDLSIDPNLGEAAIVPYGEKAQLQIMYGGYTQLALRSGQYKTIGWKVIHQGELEVWDELTGELKVNSSSPEADVVGYAAKFTLTNGFEKGSYWSTEQCMAHAKRFSKAYRAGLADASKRDYSIWFTDPDRACLKTVLKMLLKLWGPKSIQMQTALKVDEGAVINAETGEVDYIDSTSGMEISKPEFESPKTTVETPPAAAEPSPTPKEKPDAEPAKESAASPDAPHTNMLRLFRGYINISGLKEAEVLNYMMVGVGLKFKKLEDIPEETLEVLVDGKDDLFKKINEAKAQ